jgi:hypothetical protein
MKKFSLHSLLSTIGTAAIMTLTPAVSHAAGSASYILSPSTGSHAINSIFSVGVFENGSSVNVATANLNYNASQLEFEGVNAATAPFGGDVSSTGGNGSVSISRYVTPAGSTASGSVEVGAVTFKVLAGSGSTTVNVASSSMIESNGSNIWDGVNNSATYSLTTPAPVTTTTSGSTGSSSKTSTSANNTGTKTSNNGSTTNAGSSTASPSSSTSTTPTTNSKVLGTTKKSSGNNGSNTLNVSSVAKKSSNTTGIVLLIIVLIAAGAAFVARRKLMNNDAAKKKSVVATSTAAAATAKKPSTTTKKSQTANSKKPVVKTKKTTKK